MAQQARAPDDHLDDLSWIPSTYTVAHNYGQLQCQQIRHPLLASVGTASVWSTKKIRKASLASTKCSFLPNA